MLIADTQENRFLVRLDEMLLKDKREGNREAKNKRSKSTEKAGVAVPPENYSNSTCPFRFPDLVVLNSELDQRAQDSNH
mgnify:CR=1 FL=1